MPQNRIESIVRYSLITDAFNTTTLTMPTSGNLSVGTSFRRRTYYSDSATMIDPTPYTALSTDYQDKDYLVDHSYGKLKTVSYWLPAYVSGNAVEPQDYSFMSVLAFFFQGFFNDVLRRNTGVIGAG